ncbi:hypothetical protein LOR91_09605 [Staphylococcus aureus]|nr:hypothetical protein [Staphylococcus aureus]MRF35652.1 hypothetical protein [Staphylococcus sp. KY49P]HAR4208283.1 hypothetical protein [Staphylococcus aureus ADL-210]HAR4233218.1 hypothetical protein [Staphylococcus aureus ADL-206]ANI72934.1 hypothetical protein A7327_00150 [Staphylococcus aureus]EJX2105807.1 hypothetical protein [Staphylococcus aureus]
MIEYDLTINLLPILKVAYLFFKKVEREKWYFSGKEV